MMSTDKKFGRFQTSSSDIKSTINCDDRVSLESIAHQAQLLI